MDLVGQEIGRQIFGGGIYSKDLGVEVAPPVTPDVPPDKAIVYETERFYCTHYGCVRRGEGFSEYRTIQTPKSSNWMFDIGRVANHLIEDGRTPLFVEGRLEFSKEHKDYLLSMLEKG